VSKIPKINNRLRMYRKIKGLSQVQVASLMGLTSSSQLSRWENSQRLPPLRKAIQLSVLYNRLVTDLFFDIFDEEREKLIKKQNNETKNK